MKATAYKSSRGVRYWRASNIGENEAEEVRGKVKQEQLLSRRHHAGRTGKWNSACGVVPLLSIFDSCLREGGNNGSVSCELLVKREQQQPPMYPLGRRTCAHSSSSGDRYVTYASTFPLCRILPYSTTGNQRERALAHTTDGRGAYMGVAKNQRRFTTVLSRRTRTFL